MRILFSDAAVLGAASPQPQRLLFGAPSLSLSAQRTVVIGENGSGKSTLLRTLNALTPLSRGSLTLELEAEGGPRTVDVVASPKEARSAVGFVFSDPLSQILLPTPLEDVALSVRAGSARQRRERAQQWLNRLEVGHLAEQSVYELSSGERQRVALASVLAAQPQLLALDEPTTLLDRRQVRRLMDLILALPIPVIMATHDLQAAALFDEALWVHQAEVRRQGPAAEVIAGYARWADLPDQAAPLP